jgi:plasmid stabilization system protein ParE
MKFRLLIPADLEIEEALAWYEAISPVLKQRFLDDLRSARRQITEYPHAWHPIGRGIRRFRLERFPYGVIYKLRGDEIIVVAVAHLHRAPLYWKQRLKDI